MFFPAKISYCSFSSVANSFYAKKASKQIIAFNKPLKSVQNTNFHKTLSYNKIHSEVSPKIIFGHPNVIFRHPEVIFGLPEITFRLPEIIFGHPGVTSSQLCVASGQTKIISSKPCVASGKPKMILSLLCVTKSKPEMILSQLCVTTSELCVASGQPKMISGHHKTALLKRNLIPLCNNLILN
jgi:hypothetical protein